MGSAGRREPSEWWRPRGPVAARALGRLGSYAIWAAATIAAAVAVLPVVYLVLRAVGSDPDAWRLLARPSTLATLRNTLLLTAAVVACGGVLAVPLAWLTVYTDLPGRRAWAVAAALPLVVPSYVSAYLYLAAFSSRGPIGGALVGLGLPPPRIDGFPGALLALTASTYPYILLTVRAALQRLDPALLQTARSLGRSPWSAFLAAVLPQLRPAIAAGGLLAALYTVRDFGAVSIMRYDTFTRVIYVQYRAALDRDSAAILSLGIVAVALTLLWLEQRSRGSARYHATSARSLRRSDHLALGPWRWPALALCSGVVGIALLLPAGMLVWWLARGLIAGVGIDDAQRMLAAAWRTGSVSAAAAIVAAVVGLPIAWLSVRRASRSSRALERLSYIGYALPGIPVALGLVYLGIRWVRPLYQTMPMLLLAYLTLFLPLAVGSVRGALLQVDQRLEAAARTLGSGPISAFRSVTLPLIMPGVGAGAALVMLSAMKELQATLILGPYGFGTLAMMVWSRVSEAMFAAAALPALALIVLASVPTALLTFRRGERPVSPS